MKNTRINFRSITINGRTFHCGDILFDKNGYLGVLHFCEKRHGFAIAEWDKEEGIVFCHCYSCEGHFELSDIDFKNIEVKGNIYIKYENESKKHLSLEGVNYDVIKKLFNVQKLNNFLTTPVNRLRGWRKEIFLSWLEYSWNNPDRKIFEYEKKYKDWIMPRNKDVFKVSFKARVSFLRDGRIGALQGTVTYPFGEEEINVIMDYNKNKL